MKKGFILPLIIALVAVIALVATFYLVKKSSSLTTNPIIQASPSNEVTANWKTYTNTKYGFVLKYPSTLTINLPSPKDYPEYYLPEHADDFVLEKTGDMTFQNANKNTLGILILSNANMTLEEIKKNPTHGGSAPVRGLSDAEIGSIPAIKYNLDCSGHTGCFVGPHVQTVHNNTEYFFSLYDEKVSNQILSTFKFTN